MAVQLDDFLDRIGRRIAELRERAGLSQEDVATGIGTTVSNYQRIEHGMQNATLATLLKIANVIGVAPIEMLRPPRRGRPKPGRPKTKRAKV